MSKNLNPKGSRNETPTDFTEGDRVRTKPGPVGFLTPLAACEKQGGLLLSQSIARTGIINTNVKNSAASCPTAESSCEERLRTVHCMTRKIDTEFQDRSGKEAIKSGPRAAQLPARRRGTDNISQHDDLVDSIEVVPYRSTPPRFPSAKPRFPEVVFFSCQTSSFGTAHIADLGYRQNMGDRRSPQHCRPTMDAPELLALGTHENELEEETPHVLPKTESDSDVQILSGKVT
ncbi:hypothetical protein V8E55_011985 [Tylopilus felleus]